jgi:hypothetical protein
MNTLRASLAGISTILIAGLVAGCGGGSYGGGGNNPPASLNMTIDPDTITLGESATITWNTNGNSCTASGAWSGMKAGDGTETVTPTETGTLTYSLVCRGGGYGASDTAHATLTVEAARVAGLFVGEACCVDAEPLEVAVLASGSGSFRLLTRGVSVVGEAGKAPMVFEAGDSLAGRRLVDSKALQKLAVTSRGAASGSLLVSDRAAMARHVDFAVPFDKGFNRKASLDALEGIYSVSTATGYSFTLTVDRTGEVNGSDSRGCVVRGVAALPPSGIAAYRLSLELSSCGRSDGRFAGSAALVNGTSARPGGLFLSASNENFAMGWRLTR